MSYRQQQKHAPTKTSKQLQKEAEEAKRKREAEEVAQVYSEFVATFDNPVTSGPKAWVKGTTFMPSTLIQPDETLNTAAGDLSNTNSSGGSTIKQLYRPQQRFASTPSSSLLSDIKEQDATKTADAIQQTRSSRKRDMDAYLAELKKEQEERDLRLRQKHARLSEPDAPPVALFAAFEQNQGSHDTGDPFTTNLYIGNIAPTANEEDLYRGRNTGFVSFMTRQDAATALKELDGKDIQGNRIKLGWGKAVPLPAQPIYVYGGNTGIQMKTGLPFNAQIPSAGKMFVTGATLAAQSRRPEIRVFRPESEEQVMLIHRMVERVVKHGPMFEAMIMDRELENPKFAFLFQNDTPDHVYYRWKLYSILQGDGKKSWPSEPFQMFDEGPVWTPPDIPFDDRVIDLDEISDDSDASEGPDGVKRRKTIPGTVKGSLSRLHRIKLEALLRRLTFERGTIARAMVFCIDHADAADEIADIIIKSLMIQATPVFPNKISRLYLVNDILHNSATTVPNVWKYRNAFETRLTPVFEHLATVWQSIAARLRAEQMRRALMAVLMVWETWLIFPSDYIQGLRTKFSESRSETLAQDLRHQRESEAGAYGLDESFDESKVFVGDTPPKSSNVNAYGAAFVAPVAPLPDSTNNVSNDTTVGADIDEDVDGIPLANPAPIPTNSGSKNMEVEKDDDDDVDGVPLALDQRESPSKSTASKFKRIDEDADMFS
ncbi:hypothetical protein SeMB42_g00539 [Synchytrium endobioticum]|uniref:U2 snRNP-associated SURP motif-containing protein n=1 Tax=Synchytrium endobioticum TaxID=286115 RepID=A0A507DQ91_9FUNG|nr:hypothetical protein SeMB42_g00539 [Synchytrium endobioticum]